VEVLRSSGSGVVFEVHVRGLQLRPSANVSGAQRIAVAGFETRSRPGEPAVPSIKCLIALPPRGTFTVKAYPKGLHDMGSVKLEPMPFLSLGDDGMGGVMPGEHYSIGDAYYEYESPPWAEAEPVVHIRHQRVLPVWVTPVSYDPKTGRLEAASSIEVHVTFVSPGTVQDGFEPALEPPAWDRILSRVLVNPGQARAWRVRKRPRMGGSSGADRPSRLPPGPLFKVAVRTTGMHRIKASDLVAAGFPAGTPVSDLRLFKRTYDEATMTAGVTDIPITIKESPGGVAGIFDGDDYMIFYGLRLRDDASQGDPIEKFSDHNVYWVAADAGATMAKVTLRKGFVGADTASAYFEVLDRYEEDRFFQEQTPKPNVFDPPLLQDSYFYNGPNDPFLEIPFRADGIKPGTTLQLRGEIIGGNLQEVSLREISFTIRNSKGDYPLNSAFVYSNSRQTYISQPVQAQYLDDGVNLLRITPAGGRTTLRALVNWMTVEYSSLYHARGDFLRFDTGAALGDTSITVTRLSRRDLLLFDVTDPYAPRECILADSLFTDSGGDQVLSFRENLAAEKRFILTPLDSVKQVPGSDITLDAPSNIIGNPAENGTDVLVVAYKDFLPGMQQWVDYRRAQGYRVFMVDVEDVFDEFNGGVPGAQAVKRFIEYYYEKAGAGFVVLVGDASEDAKRVHQDSGVNFVPTQSYPERIQSSPFNEDEVVTTDKWYVMMDNDFLPSQTDYYPDLIIGRIPAGDQGELQIMLDKTFLFEKPKASDFWRRRMIQLADDAWSDEGFTGRTCFRASELGFEAGEESAAAVIDSSIAGGFEVVREYLSKFTNVIHPANSGCVDKDPVQSYTRAYALPDLLGQIEQGATLLSIQAHMNRYLITHEMLFSSSNVVGRDHYKLQNFGMPFVVFAMGCHLSDYAIFRELARTSNNDVNGDCLDELLLVLKNRGAVAAYGSTGFEYLGENVNFTNKIYETFFTNPPVDTMVSSGKAQARWILGEVMTASEILGANTGQIKRYHILGDPLLAIDAGPPRFDVTVNGVPVNSGDPLRVSGSDTISVVAIVSDENAIEKFGLEIDGRDETDSLVVVPLVDTNLSAARKYRVSFRHKLETKKYDITLRAFQAPDTTSGVYNMAAEFVLMVNPKVDLAINGRVIGDGALVPAEGNYVLEIGLPIYTAPEDISITIDGAPVVSPSFSHPSPADSTTWLVNFTKSLAEGEHTLKVTISGTELKSYTLRVSSRPGLRRLIVYPNPFTDDAYFVFDTEVPIEDGDIEIFTSSGSKIARLRIPPSSRMPGQNAVHWDGRDFQGDEIANGLYLYVVTVVQNGASRRFTGKMVRMK
jgi:hypothetical protein